MQYCLRRYYYYLKVICSLQVNKGNQNRQEAYDSRKNSLQYTMMIIGQPRNLTTRFNCLLVMFLFQGCTLLQSLQYSQQLLALLSMVVEMTTDPFFVYGCYCMTIILIIFLMCRFCSIGLEHLLYKVYYRVPPLGFCCYHH